MLNDQRLATLTVTLFTGNDHPADITTLPALSQRLANVTLSVHDEASNHLRRGSLHAPLTDRTDRARGEQLG